MFVTRLVCLELYNIQATQAKNINSTIFYTTNEIKKKRTNDTEWRSSVYQVAYAIHFWMELKIQGHADFDIEYLVY